MASLPAIESRTSFGSKTEPDVFSRLLLTAMVEFRDGNFAVRLPAGLAGVKGRIADAFNEIVAGCDRRVHEAARVSRSVGTAVTQRDLTRSIHLEVRRDVADLKDTIDTMINHLRATLRSNQDEVSVMTSIPESTSPLQWHGDATMSVRDAVPTHPEPLSPGGDPAVPGVTISPGEDLSVLRQVLRSLQPNVMVVGPRASTVDLLSEVLASCRQPVHDVAAWPQLAWPPAGTLIFRNIGTISRSEQKVLQDRLDEEPVRVQVVSLSPTPVFPLVADGTFSAELFYRLNVVTLIAGGP